MSQKTLAIMFSQCAFSRKGNRSRYRLFLGLFVLILAAGFFSHQVWAGKQKTVRLSIQGMTCPLCVAAVNKALRTTSGVISAKADLHNEQADIQVPQDFDVHQLVAAVQKAGYEATLVNTVQALTGADTKP